MWHLYFHTGVSTYMYRISNITSLIQSFLSYLLVKLTNNSWLENVTLGMTSSASSSKILEPPSLLRWSHLSFSMLILLCNLAAKIVIKLGTHQLPTISYIYFLLFSIDLGVVFRYLLNIVYYILTFGLFYYNCFVDKNLKPVTSPKLIPIMKYFLLVVIKCL